MSPPTLHETATRTETALVGWRIDRLRQALAGPLCIVGAGGSLPVARLWATLHARAGYPAWATTPLELRERIWPTDTVVLVLSASGRHHDILGAARHALTAGHAVHAVTGRADAPLIDLVREAGAHFQTLVLEGAGAEEGLAARNAAVPMVLLAGRLHARGDEQVDAGLFEVPALLPPDPFGGRPSDVVALGAGLARPAAEAFAHLVRESGLAPARTADARDFAHGEFVAVGAATRLAVFGLADQPWLAPYLAALPSAVAPLRLIDPRPGAPGAVALYARALDAAGIVMRAAGAKPGRESIPPWAATLYRLSVDD